jgi:predicted signal transduction protein with EAL and GGDEF domain
LEELNFLQANHCDEVQGYYFSRPLPAEQFAKFLACGPAIAPNALRPVARPLAVASARRATEKAIASPQ